MAAQLYIHIGLHKTASTTIQAFFAQNARILPDHGILYPDAGRARGPGHVNLTWELVRDQRFSAEWGRWVDVAALVDDHGVPTVVVSSEDLSMIPPSRVRDLGDQVARFAPIIIVYLRPQEGMIQSVYAQHCRDGRTVRTFPEFVKGEQDHRRYRFADLLKPWSAVFGDDAVRVRVLETPQLVGGSVLHDFMDAIDGPMDIVPALKPILDQNRSPDGAALETLRRLALLQQQAGTFDRVRFATTVGTAVGRAALQLEAPKARYMSGAVAAAFRSRYDDQNATIARRYLGRPDGRLFAPVGDPSAPVDAAPALTVDYLLALLDRVIADSAT